MQYVHTQHIIQTYKTHFIHSVSYVLGSSAIIVVFFWDPVLPLGDAAPLPPSVFLPTPNPA